MKAISVKNVRLKRFQDFPRTVKERRSEPRLGTNDSRQVPDRRYVSPHSGDPVESSSSPWQGSEDQNLHALGGETSVYLPDHTLHPARRLSGKMVCEDGDTQGPSQSRRP